MLCPGRGVTLDEPRRHTTRHPRAVRLVGEEQRTRQLIIIDLGCSGKREVRTDTHWSGRASPFQNTSLNRESSHRHPSMNDGDVSAQDVKIAVKEMATNKLLTVFKELLDDILKDLVHDVQNSIQGVVYDAVEQVLLDLSRKKI